MFHRPVNLLVSTCCSSLMLVLAFAGCSSTGTDDTPGGTQYNPEGSWNFHFVNTQASGVCADEAQSVSDETVTIIATGDPLNYTIVAKGFISSLSNQLTGTFKNNKLTISGSYSEDGGTTTSSHVLTASDADHMSGTENWSWSGFGNTCPNGKATVTATRN